MNLVAQSSVFYLACCWYYDDVFDISFPSAFYLSAFPLFDSYSFPCVISLSVSSPSVSSAVSSPFVPSPSVVVVFFFLLLFIHYNSSISSPIFFFFFAPFLIPLSFLLVSLLLLSFFLLVLVIVQTASSTFVTMTITVGFLFVAIASNTVRHRRIIIEPWRFRLSKL